MRCGATADAVGEFGVGTQDAHARHRGRLTAGVSTVREVAMGTFFGAAFPVNNGANTASAAGLAIGFAKAQPGRSERLRGPYHDRQDELSRLVYRARLPVR